MTIRDCHPVIMTANQPTDKLELVETVESETEIEIEFEFERT